MLVPNWPFWEVFGRALMLYPVSQIWLGLLCVHPHIWICGLDKMKRGATVIENEGTLTGVPSAVDPPVTSTHLP